MVIDCVPSEYEGSELSETAVHIDLELNWITQLQYFRQQFGAQTQFQAKWISPEASTYAEHSAFVLGSIRTVSNGKQLASTLFARACSGGWIGDCEALRFTSAAVSTVGTAYNHCERHCPTIITHYWKSFQKQTFWSRLQKMSRQTASLLLKQAI